MKASLACTLLLPVALFAADAQVESARQCAQQKDSLQRLVCYDRIFQAAEAKPSVAAAAPPPAKAATAAAAPAAAAPVVVASATAAAAPAMGDETLKKPQKEKAASEPKHLEAKVTAARQTRPELFRLSLDNGQVWQQQDVSSLFHVEVGDTVRIEKGSMGSYRMARADGSGWVRVTRVE